MIEDELERAPKPDKCVKCGTLTDKKYTIWAGKRSSSDTQWTGRHYCSYAPFNVHVCDSCVQLGAHRDRIVGTRMAWIGVALFVAACIFAFRSFYQGGAVQNYQWVLGLIGAAMTYIGVSSKSAGPDATGRNIATVYAHKTNLPSQGYVKYQSANPYLTKRPRK